MYIYLYTVGDKISLSNQGQFLLLTKSSVVNLQNVRMYIILFIIHFKVIELDKYYTTMYSKVD
jgi:hypothetical protein